MRPSLVLIAGPNGAGKSTLYDTRVAGVFAGPFVNPARIQRDQLGDPSMERAYAAAHRRAAWRSAALVSAGALSDRMPRDLQPDQIGITDRMLSERLTG